MAITKISSALIGANTITTGNIADNAVDGTKIAQNSILTKHIDDAQVTAGQLAADAVITAKILDANVTSAKIANNAILTQHIDDNQITTDQIAANTIATGNIADNAVDGTKIAQNSILTRHIDDAQVTAGQLAADAVITAKILDANVTSAKIANNAILTQHIDDNQITTDQIAANTIATANIADNAVDGTKIASNSILTRHIDDDQVTGAQLADTLNIVTALGINGSPAEKLHVTGGNLKMSGTSDGSNGIILLYSASGAESGQIYPHGGDLKIYSPNDVLFTGDELHDFAGFINVAKSARIAQVDLSSSSNAVAWDSVAAANAYHVTTENTTFSAPSNSVQGAVISVELAQGSTARTIAWNTVFEFAASTAPTVTATASKTDIFTFRYNGSVWQEIGRVQNMAQT